MFEFLFGRSSGLTPEERLDQDTDRVLDEVGDGLQNVNWDVVRALRGGDHLSRVRGSGMELMQLRSFIPGQDEMRMLAARPTMKAGGEYGKWVVRDNLSEQINIDYLLMDVAPTHDFGNLRESKLWLCARAGATAAMATDAASDLLGFIAYADDQVVHHMQPNSPKRILRDIIGTILEPPAATGDIESGLESAFGMLPTTRSTVTWITDCLNLTERQKEVVAEAAGRHRILAVVPQDLREWMLPEPPRWWPFPYRLKVFDLTSHKRYSFWCTRRNRARYTEEFMRHTEELSRFFEEVGISYAIVHTEHEVEMAEYQDEEAREQAIAEQRMDQILKVQQLFCAP